MGARAGLDCYLYRNTGSFGSPSWNLVPNVRDATLTQEATQADASTRVSIRKKYIPGQIDAGFEFQMVDDPADPDFEAFRDAFHNRTSIDCLILDGPVATTGMWGIRGPFFVFSFNRGEPLDDTAVVDVAIKPAEDGTGNYVDDYEVP